MHGYISDRLSKAQKHLLILPAVLIVAAALSYPVWTTIRLSISNRSGHPVGLANFYRLFEDPLFLYSLIFTLSYAVTVVALALAVGLAAALIVNSDTVRWKGVWQTIFILPMMVAPVVSGMTWRIMFHPVMGVVNHILAMFGISRIEWLSEPTTAIAAVVVIDVWQSAPFFFFLIYAALQLIPREIYEASQLDGANRLQIFGMITLPFLQTIIGIAIMFKWIDATRAFAHVMAATGGGPGTSTYSWSVLIYQSAFKYQQVNYASAIALVVLVITIIGGVIMMNYVWRQENRMGA